MVFLTSVEPFNRKLILNSRGTGADLPIQSNEAMAFRWISGLINHLYLHYSPSLWQGAKPRTPTTEFSLTSFPNYFLHGFMWIWRKAKPRTLILLFISSIANFDVGTYLTVVLVLMVFSEYFPLFEYFFFN